MSNRVPQDTSAKNLQSRKLRWKIDFIILPIFFITQGLQFLDKTALNYANLFGYQKALGLKGLEFNYLSAMVYVGYFLGQYPCGWLIGRFPAQRVLAVACLFWGVLVLILTQCRSFGSALAVRFLHGYFRGRRNTRSHVDDRLLVHSQ